MKRLLSSIIIATFLWVPAKAQQKKDVPEKVIKVVKTVPSVDLQRYAGKWFEIARFPNWFQKECAGEVTAEYQPRLDGRLDVINRCKKSDGSFTEAKGIAKVVDKESKARLKVTFSAEWLHWLPMVWEDYWIIGLDSEYSYAVVGIPGRKYLWILSRTQTMRVEQYEDAVKEAGRQGFDISKLVKTEQAQ